MRANAIRRALPIGIAVVATAIVTTTVVSQPFDSAADQAQAMAEAWARYAEPGPAHRRLAALEGEWAMANQLWLYPGADPIESSSTAEFESAMGGRYLIQRTAGTAELMGQVFKHEGMGIYAFENQSGKHTFAWIDNSSTAILTGEGEAIEDGDVITYRSEVTNPLTGKPLRIKSVITLIDLDHYTFEMYEDLGHEEWFLNFKSTAARR